MPSDSKLSRIVQTAAKSWILGNLILRTSAVIGFVLPWLRARTSGFLREAAEGANCRSYLELICSNVPSTHSPTLAGEFIGSGYFGFSFHFAFVTGMFFPEFLERAIENPAVFYARELSSSVLVAVGVTAFMVIGHMGVMAIAAYRTNNLSEHIEREWDRILGGGGLSVSKFCVSFLTIPLGKFPGVVRSGMSFELEGESPLEVSGSAPMFWDRVVSYAAWAVSAPLIGAAVLRSAGAIPHLPVAVEWLTRIAVPLAFVATIGTYLTGKGAYRACLAERRFGGARRPEVKHRFDLTVVREALSKGEGHG